MNLGISIPVHEQMEVVCDQIRNINYFVQNPKIVLHISRQFKDFNENMIIDEFDNVHINPVRFFTSLYTPVLSLIHVSNYLFLNEVEDIDYFSLNSSNELFIKRNVEKYIQKFDAGVSQIIVSLNTEWIHGKQALKDKKLTEMRIKYNIHNIYGSQIEGSFYTRKIFLEIAEIIKNEFDYKHGVHELLLFDFPILKKYISYSSRAILNKFSHKIYSTEEVYFPTLASNKVKRIGHPYCYLNWKNNLALTIKEIKLIKLNKISLSVEKGKESNLFLSLSAEKGKESNFFSVKRVPRIMDDEIRRYIRSHTRNL